MPSTSLLVGKLEPGPDDLALTLRRAALTPPTPRASSYRDLHHEIGRLKALLDQRYRDYNNLMKMHNRGSQEIKSLEERLRQSETYVRSLLAEQTDSQMRLERLKLDHLGYQQQWREQLERAHRQNRFQNEQIAALSQLSILPLPFTRGAAFAPVTNPMEPLPYNPVLTETSLAPIVPSNSVSDVRSYSQMQGYNRVPWLGETPSLIPYAKHGPDRTYPTMSHFAVQPSYGLQHSLSQSSVVGANPTSPYSMAQLHTPERQMNFVPIPVAHFVATYANLINGTEAWATRFAGICDPTQTVRVSSDDIAFVKGITNAAIAEDLLKAPNTRYLVMTKVILYFFCENALRPKVIRGFRNDYDDRLYQCRSRIYVGISLEERRAILHESIAIVTNVLRDPKWDEYQERLARYRSDETWRRVSPFLAEGVELQLASEEMNGLWRQAIRIGLTMMLQPSDFTTSFPPIGPSSHYIPATMVSKDSDYRESPNVLARMGLSVRLAITPVLMETVWEGSGAIHPRTLSYAKVLLQKA